MSMTKFATTVTVCAAFAVSLGLLPSAQAAVDSSAASPAKKTVKHKKAVKKAVAQPVEAEVDDPDADITGSVSTDFNCEMGNKVTIYTNTNDADHIALRWKRRLHRLQRVNTTTGAQRFENPLFGLIWIGIPSKGILLDSKRNQQLANECKDAEQMKPPVTAAAALAPAGPVSEKTVLQTK